MSAADTLEVERAATRAAVYSCGLVAFWACIAAQSCNSPAMQGQALGFAINFAHRLIDRGAEPRAVRSLLEVANLTGGAS